MTSPRVTFVEASGRTEARLGVVTVGQITTDGVGHYWAAFLPGLRVTPLRSFNEERARASLKRKILEWCEAANVTGAAR
ncbi:MULTISPECIES: hypothetical protein [unclassified Bradyrhizobium]|uniref:hypothetical protein n=1 Tax=unclassified Bradyrhizobium TaxID=2631580 RepID=UPI002915DCF3|nr:MULTISPECIES: hypothetical protein [unclassified Bradyrhizobium]